MRALRKSSDWINTQGSWRAVKCTSYSKQTRGKDNLCKVFWLPWFLVCLIIIVAIIYLYLLIYSLFLLFIYSSPHMHTPCTPRPVTHWCCSKPHSPQKLQGKRRQGPWGQVGHQSLEWADRLGGTRKLLSSSETRPEDQWSLARASTAVRVLWEGKTQASDMVACTCLDEKKLWKRLSHQSPMPGHKRFLITVGRS